MRTHPERPVRVRMWIAGVSLCLLLASSVVGIVRSIAVSFASIPDEGVLLEHEVAADRPEATQSKNSQTDLAQAATNRRNRTRCAGCGVIESMRSIESSGDASGSAIAADAVPGKSYEITVRFRDGSTTVFNEGTPRAWRVGSRVIVIAGSDASSN